jgi:hypothetical protein
LERGRHSATRGDAAEHGDTRKGVLFDLVDVHSQVVGHPVARDPLLDQVEVRRARGNHLAAVDGAFGQDPDRRDVGQGKVCGEE